MSDWIYLCVQVHLRVILGCYPIVNRGVAQGIEEGVLHERVSRAGVMNGSLWMLAVLLLIHLPSSVKGETLGLHSSPSSSRRLLAHQSSQAAAAYTPSTIDCSNDGSMSCASDARIAVRTSILPRSRTLTIVVVVIFVACIVMGFFSVYARRFCIREGDVNTNYQSVERAQNLQALVGSLPTVQYAGSKAAEEVQEGKARKNMRECAVCLSEFEEGEVLRLLPACGHLFHKDCIDMWLFSHTTCPLCRLSLFTKPKQAASNSPPPRVPPLAIDRQPILSPPAATSSP